jgi:membrane-associated phospholipid phosphatase
MDKELRFSTRAVLVLTALTAMLLYIPANRLATGGYDLQLPLDKLIPLIPVFVVPYLLALPLWILSVIFFNYTQAKSVALRFSLGFIIAALLSAVIYIIVPTFVSLRPEIVGNDLLSVLLRNLYANDLAYNAAPSGHTFFTVLWFLVVYRLKPGLWWLWGIISATIIVSTLFTRQHNLLDVVAGIIFAFICDYLAKLVISYYRKHGRIEAKTT